MKALLADVDTAPADAAWALVEARLRPTSAVRPDAAPGAL
jgi:hypothetical protein